MLSFSSEIMALPARLQGAIREQQAEAEILIAGLQLAIVLRFSVVYAEAPKSLSGNEPVRARDLGARRLCCDHAVAAGARLSGSTGVVAGETLFWLGRSV